MVKDTCPQIVLWTVKEPIAQKFDKAATRRSSLKTSKSMRIDFFTSVLNRDNKDFDALRQHGDSGCFTFERNRRDVRDLPYSWDYPRRKRRVENVGHWFRKLAGEMI